jgi:hypothetical protein
MPDGAAAEVTTAWPNKNRKGGMKTCAGRFLVGDAFLLQLLVILPAADTIKVVHMDPRSDPFALQGEATWSAVPEQRRTL